MIRTLLATTALAAVLTIPVIAQDSSMMSSEMPMDSSSMMSSEMTSSEMPMDSSSMMSEAPMDASSMMSSEAPMMSSETPMDSSSSMMSTEVTGPFDIVTGYTQIDSDRFATRIIGQPVYDGTGADANTLGNINDIVIDESGRAIAVSIGVGGFLGMGEKQVAVAFTALTREVAHDNTMRYVVATTVEELTAAPEFVVVEADAAMPVNGGAMAPAATDAMGTSSVAP